MLKKSSLLLIAILCSLYGCAATPIAVRSCPKAADLTPEMQVPAPLPLSFSVCLREIIAVGVGQQDQISAKCSALLLPAQTK